MPLKPDHGTGQTMAAQQIKKKTHQNLTPREKQEIITVAVQNPNLSKSQIADLQGVDRTTVSKILKRYNTSRLRVDNFKEYRADIFAGLQERLLSSITPAEIKKMQPGSRVLAAAQLYDKEAIERGVQDDGKSRPLVVIVKGGNVQVNAGSGPEKASRVGYPQDKDGYPQIGDSSDS